jgi:hypothetical protein
MSASELSYENESLTLEIRNLQKGISNVRNNRISHLDFDVAWSHTDMAAQQKLGLCTKRRPGVGHIDFDHLDGVRQNLN